MKKMPEGYVLGSCNLELCVENAQLAERLSKWPKRKIYPLVERDGNDYLVRPGNQVTPEQMQEITGGDIVVIPEGKITKIIAAGGGANAAKAISALGGEVVFITSIGPINDPNYELMKNSLTEKPRVKFEDIPGRPSVGITFNIYGGGFPSTLLIYGKADWDEKFPLRAKDAIGRLSERVPVMAIALSPQYLPLLDATLNRRQKIELLLPSRFMINSLESGFEKYFQKTQFIQANIDEWKDMRNWSPIESKGWADIQIVTDSERGGSFLSEQRGKSKRYLAYPIPGSFIDDTGCGDVFGGALFWSYFLQQKSLEESIEFAAACATFPITSTGATGKLGSKEEIENWIRRHGPKIVETED